MTTRTDPDPDKRITNSDEQEVAVNQSTHEEGGFDEPASVRQAESPVSSETENADTSNPEKRDPERKESSTRRKAK